MFAIAIATVATLRCGDNVTSPAYTPALPTTWAAAVSNPFFPLVPGTTFTYAMQGGSETNTVEVLRETKVVNGVIAVVVLDRVFESGKLIEETHDWYAQDAAGNVWYLGEDSKEMDNGKVVSTEGSWEWGLNGALPGVVMWADPAAHVGEAYRQEYYRGKAEDWGRVVSVNQSVSVPFGNLTGCIRTDDWSGLEGGTEQKYYCPTVGTVLEVESASKRSQLITVTKQ